MSRYLAGALLVLFLSQSAGVALARVPGSSGNLIDTAEAFTVAPPILASIVRPAAVAHPIIHHTPLPRRPAPNYGDPRRLARLNPKRGILKEERAARPIDLTKLRHSLINEHHEKLQGFSQQHTSTIGVKSHRFGPLASPPPSVTGLWPWWTYQVRSVPGIGAAMVNVANFNFLVAESDVDIPAGELDLSFDRMYNSESKHDATNDDNSTPSVYGNRWTNNLDIHLAWIPGTGSIGTVSVYTADGARDDFNCNVSTTMLCSAQTAGIYDLLAPTQIGGSGVACQFQLTKKSGISYIFNAPYQGCTFGQGSYGRLLAAYGRNNNFSLQLAYSWQNGDGNPENLAGITVTHEPDGAQLNLTFGQITGTSITELLSIERPDKQYIYYFYASNGELDEISKPGNNPVLPSNERTPSQFLDGNPIAKGNLPETYDIEQPGLMEVCGPRATISIIDTNQNPTDGACVDFDYDNHQLSDWYTRGVLNPVPQDGVLSPSAIQNGPNQGFVQWDDTMFIETVSSNCEGNISNATFLSDAYGHEVTWCYDASSRVFQTQLNALPNAPETEQTWDSNNNPTSITDGRSYTTKMAYDVNGNAVEVSLPNQTTSQGTLRPTYLFDYDTYNNLLYYCDPANNKNNGWNPSDSDTLCEQSGSTYFTKYAYTSDPNETYGCLSYSYTPSGYERQVTYGGGCGVGLPTEIQAVTYYKEADGTKRQPTQTFTYYNTGMLRTYGAGLSDNATWTLTYTSDGMNRLRSTQDPDVANSYWCYNQDGSDFYGETPYQDQLDNTPSCPSYSALEAGATPPPYAVGYDYDADGNVATVVHHHNCTVASCPANSPAPTTCDGASVLAGGTCNFYDGLDRLVEVKLPRDPGNDLYKYPWITRYLYDLTGQQQTFQGQSFQAYGNLFKTQELVPASPNPSVTWPPSGGQVSNGNYVADKAVAYDGLDRPVSRYSSTGASTYTTETLTWDSSPLDNNVTGYLGKDCNSASQQQCQRFDYTPDGQELRFNSNDGSSPERDYTYDPDGRPFQITSSASTTALAYAYDANGNLTTSTDASTPGGTSSTSATLTHDRYPDGSEESLDVSSGTLNQIGLFTYSYRNDGPLQTEAINDNNISHIKNPCTTTLSYTYSDGQRLEGRQEKGCGNSASTTINYLTGAAIYRSNQECDNSRYETPEPCVQRGE